MGSERLPGKVLRPLAGKPLLWHMVDRLRRVDRCSEIVLATTCDPRNDRLAEFAQDNDLFLVREQNENDLAGRIAKAVRMTNADIVLKAAGDCPLVDPLIMRDMVDMAIERQSDFCSNRVRWTFPLGLSCDVISARAILWCDENLTTDVHRELFAVYVRDNPQRFKVTSFENSIDLSRHGWAVDTPEDMEWVEAVFDQLYIEGGCFGLADVLAFLAQSDR